MAALGDILRRFRFHGVPGAPVLVGVPADRNAALRAELTPVFAALEDAQRGAAQLVAAAEHDAMERRTAALEEGRRLVAEAYAGSAAARTEAADARLSVAEAECRTVLADGHAEARRVGRLAAERTDALVDLVVGHVMELAALAEEPRT